MGRVHTCTLPANGGADNPFYIKQTVYVTLVRYFLCYRHYRGDIWIWGHRRRGSFHCKGVVLYLSGALYNNDIVWGKPV